MPALPPLRLIFRLTEMMAFSTDLTTLSVVILDSCSSSRSVAAAVINGRRRAALSIPLAIPQELDFLCVNIINRFITMVKWYFFITIVKGGMISIRGRQMVDGSLSVVTNNFSRSNADTYIGKGNIRLSLNKNFKINLHVSGGSYAFLLKQHQRESE